MDNIENINQNNIQQNNNPIFNGNNIQQNDQLQLTPEIMEDFITEDIKYEFPSSEEDKSLTFDLKYVNNSIDVINYRLQKLKYDPETDIIKNEYEGGFDIWECTHDMVRFLCYQVNRKEINLAGKPILEVGCGHGLIGLFCLKAFENSFVYFQDFNLDVLKFATVPNISKNGLEDQIHRCGFLSGDWSETANKIHQGVNEINTPGHKEIPKIERFPAIFMSEVIYDPDNYGKIAQLVSDLLAEDGVCFLSSKLYYFGNHGSVDDFIEYCEENYTLLEIDYLHEIEDGNSSKRAILTTKFKKQQQN